MHIIIQELYDILKNVLKYWKTLRQPSLLRSFKVYFCILESKKLPLDLETRLKQNYYLKRGIISRSLIVRTGNHMISSAIWNKWAGVKFSKTKKVALARYGKCNLWSLKHFYNCSFIPFWFQLHCWQSSRPSSENIHEHRQLLVFRIVNIQITRLSHWLPAIQIFRLSNLILIPLFKLLFILHVHSWYSD